MSRNGFLKIGLGCGARGHALLTAMTDSACAQRDVSPAAPSRHEKMVRFDDRLL